VVLTSIFSKATRYTDAASPYYDHRRRQLLHYEKVTPTLPQAVAKVIAHAIATDCARLRYLVGADAGALVRDRIALSDQEVIEDARTMTDTEHIEMIRRRYGIDPS